MDGEGPIPLEHYYGRLSEEFGGALPSVIVAEMRRLPVGFLEQVLEYRAYANAHAANTADPKGSDKSPMRTLAQEIEFALVEEHIEGIGSNG